MGELNAQGHRCLARIPSGCLRTGDLLSESQAGSTTPPTDRELAEGGGIEPQRASDVPVSNRTRGPPPLLPSVCLLARRVSIPRLAA